MTESIEAEVIDRDTTAESTTSVAVDWYIGNNDWEQLAQFESYTQAKAWVENPGNDVLADGDRIRFTLITCTVAYEANVVKPQYTLSKEQDHA